jgi:hypothetical protein
VAKLSVHCWCVCAWMCVRACTVMKLLIHTHEWPQNFSSTLSCWWRPVPNCVFVLWFRSQLFACCSRPEFAGQNSTWRSIRLLCQQMPRFATLLPINNFKMNWREVIRCGCTEHSVGRLIRLLGLPSGTHASCSPVAESTGCFCCWLPFCRVFPDAVCNTGDRFSLSTDINLVRRRTRSCFQSRGRTDVLIWRQLPCICWIFYVTRCVVTWHAGA